MGYTSEILGAVHPAGAEAAKAATAVVPAASGGLVLTPAQKKEALYETGAVVAGALAGYFGWGNHPVLGALLGSSVAHGAYRVYTDKNYKASAANVAAVGAGVFASLKWRKHPAVGYLLGAGAASVLAGMVPGSTAYRAEHRSF